MCIEPPLPPLIAAGAAEQLAHHAAQVGALGEGVAVAAMGGREVVVRAQIDADPGGDRLLAGRQVQRPAHLGSPSADLPKALTPPWLAASAAFSKARMRTMLRYKAANVCAASLKDAPAASLMCIHCIGATADTPSTTYLYCPRALVAMKQP